jgi:hypothetical protein
VLQLRGGDANSIPHAVTVTCPNGHTATFDAKQIMLLEWSNEVTSGTSTSSRVAEVYDDFEEAA